MTKRARVIEVLGLGIAVNLTACDPSLNPQPERSTASASTSAQVSSSSTTRAVSTGEVSTKSSSAATSSFTSSSTSSSTSTQAPQGPAWNPAPCPAGWVRPQKGRFDPYVLRFLKESYKSSFAIDRTYPKAHAFGTCFRVEQGKIAELQVEFGPEVQGYPQSLLYVGITQGEGNYLVQAGPKNGMKPDKNALTGLTMRYSHFFEDPNATRPRKESWEIGKTDGFEYHQLQASWIPQQGGHHLVLRNKTSDESSRPFDLGYTLDFVLPGGPAKPTQALCDSVDTQVRCQALGCAKILHVASIDDAPICKTSVTKRCMLKGTAIDDLEVGEARTYYDPKKPTQYTAVRSDAERPPFSLSDQIVPEGWVRCAAGATTPAACDCSCQGAGCKAERLRDELEACKRPRPCGDVTRAFAPHDKPWTPNQRCLLESLRDRKPGSYRVAVNLGDPDHDLRLHVDTQGKATLTMGSCDHESDNCIDDRSWSYPSRCELADASVFQSCLDAPGTDCLRSAWRENGSSPWYLNCERIAKVDCSQ